MCYFRITMKAKVNKVIDKEFRELGRDTPSVGGICSQQNYKTMQGSNEE